MKRNQSGFTLIEIAIVLVIIGLLLGGVLKGQELINSAKVKNLATDFKNVPIYIYGYQDKYKALPGDDANAKLHLGASAVQCHDTRHSGQWYHRRGMELDNPNRRKLSVLAAYPYGRFWAGINSAR